MPALPPLPEGALHQMGAALIRGGGTMQLIVQTVLPAGTQEHWQLPPRVQAHDCAHQLAAGVSGDSRPPGMAAV